MEVLSFQKVLFCTLNLNLNRMKTKKLLLGIFLGIVIGTAIGVALDQLSTWIAIGAGIGVAMGAGLSVRDNEKDYDQPGGH